METGWGNSTPSNFDEELDVVDDWLVQFVDFGWMVSVGCFLQSAPTCLRSENDNEGVLVQKGIINIDPYRQKTRRQPCRTSI